jgi:hypothetical protein
MQLGGPAWLTANSGCHPKRSSVLFRKFLINNSTINFNSYKTYIPQMPFPDMRRGNEISSSGLLAVVLIFVGFSGDVLEVICKINTSISNSAQ